MEAQDIGAWNKIGYTGPGTSTASGSATSNFQYIEGSPEQWQVKALVKLNDCAKNTVGWKLKAEASAANANNEGHYDVKYTASGDANGYCDGLTPSFAQLTVGRSS